mgnify:CR=1 FL=1
MITPISFPLAKLLKEKGFDAPTLKWYHRETKKLNTNDLMFSMNKLTDNYSAPTIAEAVMWLYEKHGIWVRVTPIPYSDNLTHWRWEHMSTNYSTRNFKWKKEQDYMSPTEVYEAAIEYVLTKLI